MSFVFKLFVKLAVHRKTHLHIEYKYTVTPLYKALGMSCVEAILFRDKMRYKYLKTDSHLLKLSFQGNVKTHSEFCIL